MRHQPKFFDGLATCTCGGWSAEVPSKTKAKRRYEEHREALRLANRLPSHLRGGGSSGSRFVRSSLDAVDTKPLHKMGSESSSG